MPVFILRLRAKAGQAGIHALRAILRCCCGGMDCGASM
jgi:hypothetical protein